jgi:hypothetical protein
MTIFHTFLRLYVPDSNHSGPFARAAGKSIENLRRPAVAVKSMQRFNGER